MTAETIKQRYETVHNKLKVTVKLIKCVKEYDNDTGDMLKSFSEPFEIEAVINAPTDSYLQKTQGLTENSVVHMYVLPQIDITRDDEILFDGSKYRVDNPTTHQWAGVKIYQKIDLYLVGRLGEEESS
jgi:hypothetical protein